MNLEEEDEAALRAMLQQQRTHVRRIDDSVLATSLSAVEAAAKPAAAKPAPPTKPVFAARPMAVMVKKRKAGDGADGATAAAKKLQPGPMVAAEADSDGGGGLLGLGDYGSSSGSEGSPAPP